jgi:hypothetical protein
LWRYIIGGTASILGQTGYEFGIVGAVGLCEAGELVTVGWLFAIGVSTAEEGVEEGLVGAELCWRNGRVGNTVVLESLTVSWLIYVWVYMGAVPRKTEPRCSLSAYLLRIGERIMEI